MRKVIVIEARGGHFSVYRIVTRIVTNYWFPSMRRSVWQYGSMCVNCLTHKRPAGKHPGFLHPISPDKRPFQKVHVDHLGPFETSTSTYSSVLADNLTMHICILVESRTRLV